MKWLINIVYIIPFLLFSQEDIKISTQYNKAPLYNVLLDIETAYQIKFSFPDLILLDKKLTLSEKSRTLSEILDAISFSTNLEFEYVNARYIIIKNSNKSAIDFRHLNEVVIKHYLVEGLSKNANGSFHIKPKKLALLPGLTEPDVFESIQQLPNVISPNETSSGFLVRGGAADENRILWNGMNIYHKGHLFGMISPINSNAVQNINFYNKGTNPRFGERLSSVVDMTTNLEVIDSRKLELGMNGINFDAYLEQPIVKEKLSLQASFRRSYAELYNSFTLEQLQNTVFQNTKINNLINTTNDFYFMDYSLQLNYKLSPKNKVSIYTIGIKNYLNYIDEVSAENQSFRDAISTEDYGYGINWDTQWTPNINQNTQAFFTKYAFKYNDITIEDEEQRTDFEKRNVIYDSGISSEIQVVTTNKNHLALGYQYALKDVGYAFLNTDTNLTLILDSDDTVIETHSVYGNYQMDNIKDTEINLGLRATYFSYLNTYRMEPRLQFTKKLFTDFRVQLTGEIKNQIISEIDETVLSDLYLENKLWRLADNETFPIINSTQVSAGILYTNKGWQIDLDTYLKNIDGKTALSLGYLNPDASNFNIGKQNIVGSDIFIKKTFNPFKAWLSYSFNAVKNEFEGINEGNPFTASTNIKHTVSTSLVYKKKQYQFAIGWKWHSGKPFTKATTNDQGEIVFNNINTGVLPNFHRLDVSGMYHFKR
ncbi:MAG: hypothetical protein NWP64_07815, partial [Maribacter sp.]|nr:hypothetical protein [Maribacter sp.]